MKIFQLRAPMDSLSCVSLIEVLSMKRKKSKEPPIFRTFANLIELNFNLGSLSFSPIFNKIHPLFFFLKQLSARVYFKFFHSSSKPLHFPCTPKITSLLFDTPLFRILKLQLTSYIWSISLWHVYLEAISVESVIKSFFPSRQWKLIS